MSKRNKKANEKGTYALCITAGVVVGLGLGPMLDNVLLSVLIGAALGIGAGYYFNNRKPPQPKPKRH